MPRREQGSTPLVGSSRTTVPDAPMKAMPMASFLFMPPESTRVCLCRCSVNSTSRRVLKQEQSPHSSPSTPRSSTADGTPQTRTSKDAEEAWKRRALQSPDAEAPAFLRLRGNHARWAPCEACPAGVHQVPSSGETRLLSGQGISLHVTVPSTEGPAFPPKCALLGSEGAKRRSCSTMHHRVVRGRPLSRGPPAPRQYPPAFLTQESGSSRAMPQAKYELSESIRVRVSHRCPPAGLWIPDARSPESLPLRSFTSFCGLLFPPPPWHPINSADSHPLLTFFHRVLSSPSLAPSPRVPCLLSCEHPSHSRLASTQSDRRLDARGIIKVPHSLA